MESFVTCRKEEVSEFCEKKSVFRTYIFPETDFSGAMAHLEKIKAETPDANHHVWAFINREKNVVRFSDDGEPKGTAGMPMLEVLKKAEVSGVFAVTVRYFGGILLGAGGLSRAYSRGVRDCLEKSGITRFVPNDVYSVKIPYSKLAVTESQIEQRKITVLSKSFDNEIRFELMSTNSVREKFDEFLSDNSGGKLKTEFIKTDFAPEQ